MKLLPDKQPPNQQTSQTGQLDERVEKVFVDAVRYCKDTSTEKLENFLTKASFPDLREDAVRDGSHFFAYNIVMGSLALQRRPDKNENLSTQDKERLDLLAEQSSKIIEHALCSHEKRMSGYEKQHNGKNSDAFFYRTFGGRNCEETLDRMILFHAVPEYYGGRAAPKTFVKAAKLIAAFWGHALDKGSKVAEQVFSSRQEHGASNLDDLRNEAVLLNAMKRQNQTYTENQIKSFRQNLVRLMFLTGTPYTRTDYHPDLLLSAAVRHAGINAGMTTFPSKVTTMYREDGPKGPRIEVHNGHMGEPQSYPLTTMKKETVPQRTVTGAKADALTL